MKKLLLIAACFIFLNTTAQNVGIGTTTPAEKLEVIGGIKVGTTTGANAGTIRWNNNHLQVYSGTAWVNLDSNASAYGWLRTGNAGTNSATNFIGTTDNVAISFKVNNIRAGLLDPATSSAFYGIAAGNANTTGSWNTACGGYAFYNNTTGDKNTSSGFRSLYYNTTGYNNTANGAWGLYNNTNGNNNTSNGYYALYSSTTGSFNTADGSGALQGNTSGNYNTANGYIALNSNTTGSSNIAIGVAALKRNTTASNLVAVGDSALYNNGIGALYAGEASNNTAMGSKALFSNTYGFKNTANGNDALYSNTHGYYNTANGSSALYSNTTGDFNTANGVGALYSNTTGFHNTTNGSSTLNSNTTGSNNTAMGSGALITNTTGSNNTVVGNGANVNAGTYSNSTALGSTSTITASNQVRIGNSSVTSIGGQVGWTTISDARVKTNIQNNVPGLDFILKLNPVTYNIDVAATDKLLRPDAPKLHDGQQTPVITQEELDAKAAKSKIIYTGFIAQDVEAAAKKTGYDFSGVDAPKNDRDLYGLRYAEFVVPLVKAVQEQQMIIEMLKKENVDMKNRLLSLESKK